MSDSSDILARLKNDMKDAMRSHDKERLQVIRLALAAVKQKEVDERVTLTDDDMLVLLDKMLKQRRESINQYKEAGRDDLANQEQFEIDVLKVYLPQPLDESELKALIQKAIDQTGAHGMSDMGKVMAIVKPAAQGRADMTQVSQQVKALLA